MSHQRSLGSMDERKLLCHDELEALLLRCGLEADRRDLRVDDLDVLDGTLHYTTTSIK